VSARFMAAAIMGVVSLGLAAACVPASEPARAALAEQAAASAPAAVPVAAAAPVTAPAAAAGGANEALRAKGRELFSNWGCIACHKFSDADGHGDVGPPLDGGAHLTKAFVISRVTNGQGAMPAFGGQMTEEEIADLAAYIETFKK
jgi:mono/diheme cytochrome c family protein